MMMIMAALIGLGAASTPVATAALSQPVVSEASVPEEIAFAASEIQRQVPIRQGPTTITGARAEGMELIMAMTLPVPLNQQIIEAVREQVTPQQCANPVIADLIRRGARFSYDITDAGGLVFRVTVSRCPDAPR